MKSIALGFSSARAVASEGWEGNAPGCAAPSWRAVGSVGVGSVRGHQARGPRPRPLKSEQTAPFLVTPEHEQRQENE